MAAVQIGRGVVALVDDADLELVSRVRWGVTRPARNHVYAFSGKRPRLLMHRYIMGAERGQFVDHINGDTLDNRRENLRLCTFAENLRNRRRASNSNFTYKGVGINRLKKRYTANIRLNGKRTYLGTFDTIEEAASAYDMAAVLRFGEFACLNFPHVFPELSQRSA